MSSVPITIIGTMTDKETSQNVTIVGMAQITGLEVGGGPMPGGPGRPGIWPGGHPEHPIVLPPDHLPLPPGIWPDPPEGQAPLPEHPIVIPPPPGISGPQLEVKTIWTPESGWQIVLVPTGDHVTPSSGRRR